MRKEIITMAKDLTDEEVQELAKKLVKTDKVFKKVEDVEALDDEKMEEVNGGFISQRGYTAGLWIFCPYCGATEKKWFIHKGEYARDTDLYYCNCCGTLFAADYDGHIYETP